MSDFWSRRRAAVQAEARAEETAALAAEEAARDAQLAERSDEELLRELGLPMPDAIDSADTVRSYLRAALPKRLKQQALRRLWRMNPVLANLDGLIVYGEDYTDRAKVVDDLRTSYQVGKGLLAHVEKLAAGAEPSRRSEMLSSASEDEAGAPDHIGTGSRDAAPEQSAIQQAEEPGQVPATSCRRMRFRFETGGEEVGV